MQATVLIWKSNVLLLNTWNVSQISQVWIFPVKTTIMQIRKLG